MAGRVRAGARLDAARRVRLAGLTRRVERLFAGPQDVEWAIDLSGRLWLLQARPITALPVPTGPVLGAGPLAKTFPAPLSRLEAELWLEPLAAAAARALTFVGAASRAQVAATPVVQQVVGRAVADLELLGLVDRRGRLARRFGLVKPARRLAAAWRTGRLRAALLWLAYDAMTDVDAYLLAVSPLDELDGPGLLQLLESSRQRLEDVHTLELLAGMLAGEDGAAAASGIALRQLTRGRRRGLSDPEIVRRYPVVLTLTPPAIAGRQPLPATAYASFEDVPVSGDPLSVAREGLRLRLRWLHELTSTAVQRLGVDGAEALSLDQLRAAVLWQAPCHPEPGTAGPASTPARLPVMLRRTTDNGIVAWHPTGTAASPKGVSPGQAWGRVHRLEDGTPPAGAVLVVDALEPGLAGSLPHVAALVSASGSVLSHLAILAREIGVPVVVGVDTAPEALGSGDEVLVDGSAGHVEVVATRNGGLS